jgi:hypothetical protein
MSPMREIVKVQIFVHPKYGEVSVVGTKGHRGKGQRLDPTTRTAMGDDTSAFFDAEYQSSTGRWSIGTRVKDREW